MTTTIPGAGVWKTLVETLTETDLRILRQTQIEHLVLIFALLTDQSHIFLQHDKKGYGRFEHT